MIRVHTRSASLAALDTAPRLVLQADKYDRAGDYASFSRLRFLAMPGGCYNSQCSSIFTPEHKSDMPSNLSHRLIVAILKPLVAFLCETHGERDYSPDFLLRSITKSGF